MIDTGLEKKDRFFIRGTEVIETGLGGAYGSKKIGVEGHNWKMVTKEASIAYGFREDIFGEEKRDMSPARRYFERWKYIKSLGIPTVSNMKVLDRDHIIMSDDTRDGSALFDKHSDDKLDLVGDEGRKLDALENIFLKIAPELLKSKIAEVLDIARRNGFMLPFDSEQFVIHVFPDARWQIEVRDLSFLCKKKEWMNKEIEAEKADLFQKFDNRRANLIRVRDNFYKSQGLQ